MMKKYSSWIWIALAIAVDQLTKYFIRLNFAHCDTRPVIPGLMNLTYVRNVGAAWGILAGWRYVLAALAAAMLIFIATKRAKIFGEGIIAKLSFILLFGGIVGNMIDRVVFGFVTDFLDFHIKNSHFPSFNVADSCICIGVGLFIILSFQQSRKDDKSPDDTGAETEA